MIIHKWVISIISQPAIFKKTRRYFVGTSQDSPREFYRGHLHLMSLKYMKMKVTTSWERVNEWLLVIEYNYDYECKMMVK